MPRVSRIDDPVGLYHPVARDFERRLVFRDNAERDSFIDRFGIVLDETKTDNGT